MKQTLSSKVWDCLPKSGSMTSTEISHALRKRFGVWRDVRSITGILKHMKERGQVIRVERKANDPEKVLNRWKRGKAVELRAHTRIAAPTFDSLLNANALLAHWPVAFDRMDRDDMQEGAL